MAKIGKEIKSGIDSSFSEIYKPKIKVEDTGNNFKKPVNTVGMKATKRSSASNKLTDEEKAVESLIKKYSDASKMAQERSKVALQAAAINISTLSGENQKQQELANKLATLKLNHDGVIAGYEKELALCWWAFMPLRQSYCEAAALYQITDQELLRLENNLSRLETINQEQWKQSKQLQEELTLSLKELSQAETKSKLLQARLEELRSQLETQEKLLEKANLSFKQYAQEEKQRISKLKRQRNILLVGFSSILLYGIMHKSSPPV